MNNFRYEIKFSLEELSLSTIRRWMDINTNLKKSYDDRCVNSIYFDDINYSSVKDNLVGISDRKKYRIRWYTKNFSDLKMNDPQFEIKIRKGRLGTKTVFNLKHMNNDSENPTMQSIELNLKNELLSLNESIDSYIRATLGVHYIRSYYEDTEGLRMTIDKQIKFSYLDGTRLSLDRAINTKHHKYIMEIKFNPELKNYASKLIQSLSLTPSRHSKYLLGLSRFGFVNYI
jgi:hypothetical protein